MILPEILLDVDTRFVSVVYEEEKESQSGRVEKWKSGKVLTLPLFFTSANPRAVCFGRSKPGCETLAVQVEESCPSVDNAD